MTETDNWSSYYKHTKTHIIEAESYMRSLTISLRESNDNRYKEVEKLHVLLLEIQNKLNKLLYLR